LGALLSPEGGLAALFAASFLASTSVPLSSEAVLFGYLKLHPEQLATAGRHRLRTPRMPREHRMTNRIGHEATPLARQQDR